MSVLCCAIPQFLMSVQLRHDPNLAYQPVALLDPEERVCAMTAPVRASGVLLGMTPQQARMRCADARFLDADMQTAQDEQAAFLHTLAAWEVPVETAGWGVAYVDLHSVAVKRNDVARLASEAGQAVRRTLGDACQPAIGWDSGKFTARAAAIRTQAGCIKLIDKPREVPFLAPLPISLLPLAEMHLQYLAWLGIRTLGAYARLPAVAVQQRFGKIGLLAQRWALGRDDRPVRNSVRPGGEQIHLDLETPTSQLAPVVSAIMAALAPKLGAASARLEGYRRVRLCLAFLPHSERELDIAFLTPVCHARRMQDALVQRLAALNWPGMLTHVEMFLYEPTELHIEQMALLSELQDNDAGMAEIAAPLVRRYGPIAFQGLVPDPCHPIPERRTLLQAVP